MENYALLLKREEPVLAPAPLAAALSPIVDRPVGELSRLFREQPWILLEDLPADRLDAVFAVLAKRRLQAKAVPMAHMPALPPALRVRNADPTPESFFLHFAEPPAPAVLKWGELHVVSVGLVAISAEESSKIYGPWGDEKQFRAGGRAGIPGSVPLKSGGKAPADALLLDLIAGGTEPWRLRIDAGNFIYDYLGDRMKTTSRQNLRLLLGDIRRLAPGARFTPRTGLFLEDEPVASYKFRSLSAFESYHRWMLQAWQEERASEAK